MFFFVFCFSSISAFWVNESFWYFAVSMTVWLLCILQTFRSIITLKSILWDNVIFQNFNWRWIWRDWCIVTGACVGWCFYWCWVCSSTYNIAIVSRGVINHPECCQLWHSLGTTRYKFSNTMIDVDLSEEIKEVMVKRVWFHVLIKS